MIFVGAVAQKGVMFVNSFDELCHTIDLWKRLRSMTFIYVVYSNTIQRLSLRPKCLFRPQHLNDPDDYDE